MAIIAYKHAPFPSAAFGTVAASETSWRSKRRVYIDTRHAPPGFDTRSAVVYPFFVTEEEGEALLDDVARRMKRRRYERGHWDAVISEYREVELTDMVEMPQAEGACVQQNPDERFSHLLWAVIKRVRNHIELYHIFGRHDRLMAGEVKWLPCHAIDLKKDGFLNAHVDSVKFSGGVVAGLSLLSSSIMRLRPADSDENEDTPDLFGHGRLHGKGESDHIGVDGHVDLFLPPLSLYVLSGTARYKYSHELLPCGSTFRVGDGNDDLVTVRRERRVSIIFRDAK